MSETISLTKQEVRGILSSSGVANNLPIDTYLRMVRFALGKEEMARVVPDAYHAAVQRGHAR